MSLLLVILFVFFLEKKNNNNKNDKSVPPYLDRHVLRKFSPSEEMIKVEIGFNNPHLYLFIYLFFEKDNNPHLTVLYCLKYIIYDLVISIHMIL